MSKTSLTTSARLRDNAHRALEQKLRADEDDAVALYQLGVLLIEDYDWLDDERPVLLDRAAAHLTRAVRLRPSHAASHAALGYAHDLAADGAEAALACFREAHRLKPRDRVYDVYVLTLLAVTGREQEAIAGIEAAAPVHDANLTTLRRELIAAGMPADADNLLHNGFIRARNFFKSSLMDEAERIRNRLEPGRARRESIAERKRCAEDQQELEKAFDVSRVPAALRALAAWASRYGVGDDACRPLLLGKLSRARRAKLIRDVDEHAGAIQAWLDSFGQRPMSTEAAAFMYLAQGVEEIRD